MISVEGLGFAYGPGREKILDGIDLTICPGEFVALMGHNGSGKSTLAKHFNALLVPTEGRVVIDGLDTSDPAVTLQVRQKVGMVFQNPDNQIVATVVEDDVAFALENLGIEPAEIRKRVDEALAAVGLFSERENEPHLLSGGQKQRLAIASIVAMKPEVIVFDEPTAMLDPVGRAEVAALVKKFRIEGRTIIYVTHNVEEIVTADRCIVMRNGRISFAATPAEFFSDESRCAALGIEVPAMARFSNAMARNGYDDFAGSLDLPGILEKACRYLQRT